MFSSLKSQATNFLGSYQQKNPATYAAAEQAVGAILMADGFFGTPHPMGRKGRPGIFGTISGMILGIIFIFIPTIVGHVTNINNMTATTSATVVSVGAPVSTGTNGNSRGSACSLTVSYTVNGTQYTQTGSVNSSSNCALVQGQAITINYDPANPGSWIYGANTIKDFLWIFFAAGILSLVYSIILFFVRLFSIIFGWKLLKDGRKNASALPADTNLQTMINEIKQNFTASIFGFGSGASQATNGVASN